MTECRHPRDIRGLDSDDHYHLLSSTFPDLTWLLIAGRRLQLLISKFVPFSFSPIPKQYPEEPILKTHHVLRVTTFLQLQFLLPLARTTHIQSGQSGGRRRLSDAGGWFYHGAFLPLKAVCGGQASAQLRGSYRGIDCPAGPYPRSLLRDGFHVVVSPLIPRGLPRGSSFPHWQKREKVMSRFPLTFASLYAILC
jgi:hypothetical protein